MGALTGGSSPNEHNSLQNVSLNGFVWDIHFEILKTMSNQIVTARKSYLITGSIAYTWSFSGKIVIAITMI